jgi:ABC-type sugar transport system permease subunit
MPQPSKKSLLWALAAVAAAAGMFALHRFSNSVERRIEQVVDTSSPLGIKILKAATYKDYLLAVDADRNMAIFRQGRPIASRSFEYGISAWAPDPKNSRIFAADSTGSVFELDEKLDIVHQGAVPGRVTGVEILADGRPVVCYGVSAYGPDYYLCILKPDLTPDLASRVATNFCTLLLAGDGRRIIFATVNSRLGVWDPGAGTMQTHILPHQPLSLQLAGDKIVIGDEAGDLSLLDTSGRLLWRKKISRYPVNVVTFSSNAGMIVASDRQGTVFVVGGAGDLLCRSEHTENEQPFVGCWSEGDNVHLANLIGQVKTVHLDRAAALAWVAGFRTVRAPAYAVLAALLVAAVILASRQLTGMTGGLAARVWHSRTAYLLLLPTFAMLGLFCYYPMVTAIYYSFTDYSLTKPAEFCGLANFKAMIHDPYLHIGIRNLFIFLVADLFKLLTVPLLVAELVFWISGDRLKQIFRTVFVVPTIVPGVVFVLLWRMIYEPYDGLLNQTLTAFGFRQFEGFPWLAKEGIALASIIGAGFPWINAFAFLIFLGGLINISKDIYEAAEIDGISTWKRFWTIDLPLVRPQIKLLIVFAFIFSIQDFVQVLIFTGGGPGASTYVPALEMFNKISDGGEIGYAAAIGLFLFLLIFVATVFHMKLMKTHDMD